MQIRKAQASDGAAILEIIIPVIREGATYTLDPNMSEAAALAYWMNADKDTFVAEENNVIVGSVNANKRHWYRATQALAQADRAWLARLITRRERPEAFMHALRRQPDDIKVVIQFSEA